MCSLLYLCLTALIVSTTAAKLESRVFGGKKLRPNAHKYLVRLRINFDSSTAYKICSGNVINERWILTSAHCFNQSSANVEVQQATENIKRTVATVKKRDITLYPGFVRSYLSASNLEKDLALLKTDKKMKFDEGLQSIPMAKRSPKVGEAVIIAGYGVAENRQSRPREGSTIVKNCTFALWLKTSFNLICTNSLVRAGNGDSGGSLISKGRLVGVTSSSCVDAHITKNCETVYVDIAANLKWINKVMKV